MRFVEDAGPPGLPRKQRDRRAVVSCGVIGGFHTRVREPRGPSGFLMQRKQGSSAPAFSDSHIGSGHLFHCQ